MMQGTTRLLVLTLAAGAAAALLFAAPFVLGLGAAAPLTLTGIPLMAAGLGFGVLAAIGAGLTGLMVLFGMAVLFALSSEPVVLFAALFVIPIVFAVQQLQRSRTSSLGYIEWQPPLNVMAWLLAGALLVMIVFAVMVIRGNTDLPFLTRSFLQPVVTGLFPELGFHRTRSLVEVLTPVFPGAAIAVWLILLSVATAGALALLRFWGALQRPLPRMEELQVPLWIPAAFGLAVAFALLDHGNLAYLGQNAAIALLVPVFLAGAGSFHAIARRTPIFFVVIAVFYGFMIVFPPLIAVVALIGVADQTLDLRRRIGFDPTGQEV
jgi:hypothetical protein